MRAMHSAVTALAVVVCAGSVSSGQQFTKVYSNTFSRASDIGSEWSRRDHHSGGAFSGLLGRFSWDKVTLRLEAPTIIDPGPDPDPDGPDEPDVPDTGRPTIKSLGRPVSTRPHASSDVTYRLKFDLYLIDSWDGAHPEFGNDRMVIDVNGRTIFEESLSTHSNQDNFRDPDDWGRNIGYGAWNDAIYRDIELFFTLEAGEDVMEINFFGTAGQGLDDESWALDNVRVHYVTPGTIPAPGALPALGASGLLLARRRRR